MEVTVFCNLEKNSSWEVQSECFYWLHGCWWARCFQGKELHGNENEVAKREIIEIGWRGKIKEGEMAIKEMGKSEKAVKMSVDISIQGIFENIIIYHINLMPPILTIF